MKKNFLVGTATLVTTMLLTGCAVNANATEAAPIVEVVAEVDVETTNYDAADEVIEPEVADIVEIVNEDVEDTRVWVTMDEYANLLQAAGWNGNWTAATRRGFTNGQLDQFVELRDAMGTPENWVCETTNMHGTPHPARNVFSENPRNEVNWQYRDELLVMPLAVVNNYLLCVNVDTNEIVVMGDVSHNALPHGFN